MGENYFDLTLNEFLDTITDKECIYSLSFHKSNNESDEFFGTTNQLNKIIDTLDWLKGKRKLKKKFAKAKQYTFENELGTIEMYNYLEKISGGFEPEKIKIILREVEAYYLLDFHERLCDESFATYQKNGWEIPLKEFKPMHELKKIEVGKIADYESMIRKTHPYQSMMINYATSLLKSNLHEKDKTHKLESKADILKENIGKYGFFELELVVSLSESSQSKLIEIISKKGLPYAIAMFDFLGFLNYLSIEYFKTKDKMNREVAKWFKSDNEGRAVRGNINSLSDKSTENKKRYTAHQHKDFVRTYYYQLK